MSALNHEIPDRFVSHLTRNTIALILAGGRGSRLKNMTDWRAKPAVPFGGKFRDAFAFGSTTCLGRLVTKIKHPYALQ